MRAKTLMMTRYEAIQYVDSLTALGRLRTLWKFNGEQDPRLTVKTFSTLAARNNAYIRRIRATFSWHPSHNI